MKLTKELIEKINEELDGFYVKEGRVKKNNIEKQALTIIPKEGDSSVCPTVYADDCDSYEEVVFTDLAFSHEIINTSEIIFNEFVKGKKHRFLNAFHTKLVNKDLLLKHKFNEDLRDEEDTLLATLLFMECPKIGYINQKIYFHITNKNSITHLKENEIKNINYLILSRKLIMEEFALRNYPYLNHVVSNIFIKIIYEYMVLNKKVGPLEKEREKILETFKPYGDILRPFEKKLFCALEEKKYFKLGFLTNKMILQLHMRKAKNII